MSDEESALVQELRALAGVADGDTFTVRHDGVSISVRYSGGSSSRLVLSVPYDGVAHAAPAAPAPGYRGNAQLASIRPMVIALRPERELERSGKAAGVDVEVQTKDPAFDDAVYIDTLTPTDVVVEVLAPDVRRAVLELFALELTSITIDDKDGCVVAEIVSFASLTPANAPGKKAIDAFARLARALPRVAKTAGEHAKHPLSSWSSALAALLVIVLIVSMPLYFSTAPQCVDDMSASQAAGCFGPGIVGVIVGLVGAVPVYLLAARFTRRYRGRSDSSREGAMFVACVAAIAFIVIATLVGYIVAHAG